MIEPTKDSGIAWIGRLPESWDVATLKRTTYLKGRIGWQGLTTDEYLSDGDYLLVTGTDFEGGRIQWSRCAHVDKERYAEDPYIQLRENDLLITKDGTIGKVSIVRDLPKPATLNSGVFVTRPLRKRYQQDFLYWVLVSEVFPEFIKFSMVGTTINHLYQKTFERFAYPLPSLPEQQRIAAYLDASCAAIDTAVAAKRRQLETLDALAATIIHQAVTQGLNHDAPMKKSGLDWVSEVPAHWKVQQIKRVCSLVRGQFTHRPRNDPAFYDGEYPFIQTGDITAAKKYIRTYSQTLNELGLSVSKRFPRGTLVMSIAANIGDVAILDFEACFPDSMIGMIPGHQAHLDFLFYLMRTMKGIMLRSAVLSTQLNLNYVRIGTNFAAFPPKKEQAAIAEFLDAKEEELISTKAVLNQQITTLTAYRKSLIHECVTGQRRVTEEDVQRATRVDSIRTGEHQL